MLVEDVFPGAAVWDMVKRPGECSVELKEERRWLGREQVGSSSTLNFPAARVPECLGDQMASIT